MTPFVMGAWDATRKGAARSGYADGSAIFTKALGLTWT